MTPDERHQADRLGAYADRWLDGRIDEPTTAEEATFAHLQRLLGTTPSASTTQPITRQENPMLPIASIQSPPMPTSTRHRTPVMTTLSRWQPVFSMAVMFAILAGLVGFAYTGLNRQDREPESTMLAALQDDDATPASQHCAPPPPAATEDELLAFSADDWPAPQYSASERADEETTTRVIQFFEEWYTCGFNDNYWSTRALNRGWYYDQLNPEQQAAIDVYLCIPREQEVMQHFPLTLNLQQIDPIWADYPYSLWTDAEVYVLADGRYGMAMGRLTTDIIQDSSTARAQDTLWFVAFVEENGQLYLDESFYAFSGDGSLYGYGQMSGDCD